MKNSGQGVPGTGEHPRLDDRGYILVVLLIAMGVTAIWMSAALPAWRQQAMREKEIELIFRGEQYARAIALFQIKNNSYPVDIDILVSQRYLRKKWKDPVTGEDFQLVGLTSGQGGPMRQGGPAGGPNRSGGGPGTTGVNPNRQGAASPAGPTSPTSAGRPGGSPSGMGTSQAPPGGLGRPTGGVPGGLSNQPLTGGITGVRSVSQATSIRVYNGQQQHNLWQFDAAMMMARMGRNQMPGGGGPGRGNDGRGGPARGGPQGAPGGVPGGRGGGTGPGRGGQLPPPPPPPPGPGRGAGS